MFSWRERCSAHRGRVQPDSASGCLRAADGRHRGARGAGRGARGAGRGARGAGRGARGAGRGARGAGRGARNNTPHCTTCHFYTDSYRLTTGGCTAIAVSATVGSDAVRSLVLKCARPASRVPRLASRTFGPIALKSHVSTRDVAFLGLARRMHAFHIASGPVHSAPAIAAARTAWRHPPPGIAGGHFLG